MDDYRRLLDATEEPRWGGWSLTCDLLVVFGNDVLMFSDKECEYHSGTATKVAWPRWYKRAIEKSAKQLAGAEKFAREHQQRIFLDRQCQTPLPVPLPSPDVARYFLIAVTRGAHAAARQHFGGGSSGSLMLDSSIRGREHYDHPFQLGFTPSLAPGEASGAIKGACHSRGPDLSAPASLAVCSLPVVSQLLASSKDARSPPTMGVMACFADPKTR